MCELDGRPVVYCCVVADGWRLITPGVRDRVDNERAATRIRPAKPVPFGAGRPLGSVVTDKLVQLCKAK